ncbi:MAG: TonB family protein [Pseudomonadota bacterium]
MGYTNTSTHKLFGFIVFSVLAHGLLLLPWLSMPTPSATPFAFELTDINVLPAVAPTPIQEPPRPQRTATNPEPQPLPQPLKRAPDDVSTVGIPPVVADTAEPQGSPQETTLASASEPDAATQNDAERQAMAKEQLRTRLIRLLDAHFTYPHLARKHGWEGEVLLSFQVTHSGVIEHIQISRSSGHGVLDKAAMAALGKIQQVDTGQLHLTWETLEMDLPVIYRLTEG